MFTFLRVQQIINIKAFRKKNPSPQVDSGKGKQKQGGEADNPALNIIHFINNATKYTLLYN